MRFAFTEYVRALEPNMDPDPERFRALCVGLRSALVGELCRRSLWDAPPSYLGIYGGASFSEEQVLEELLIDCYVFVFIDRLEGLKGMLETRENVDGLVFRNIRNFLFNVQRKHDPLGFRVFEVLRTAVRHSVGAGTLHVLAGDPGIRNDTVLGFAPRSDPGGSRGAQLEGLVRSWSDDLLPELVTARGTALEKVTATLARHLAELDDEGVESFRFKDVIDPFKQDVRERWRAVWQEAAGEIGFEEHGGESPALVRLVRPDAGYEERQTFQQLLARVAKALAELGGVSEKTRVYLHQLWVFVGCQVAEGQVEKLPAKQRIAEQLGIPRYRLPELLGILGRQVLGCQRTECGDPEGAGKRLARSATVQQETTTRS
ncbi:MAG: hypothetical protein GY856_01820 [bacterium]|nr:hypothetical protein [bacterium]